METKITENKMGIQPVNKLLVGMSLPMIASMLVMALYNFVDGFFVAQYSELSLTAVTLAMPVQNLMIAVAVGTGVGVNALLSRALGEKDTRTVNAVSVNGLFLAVVSSLVFAVLGICFSRVFFDIQTPDTQLAQEGTIYLIICCTASLGIFMEIMFERLLLSTGKTFYVMITQASGAIINIILDPILIFGLLGFPRMGIAGAATATVIGQWGGMLIAAVLNHVKNNEVRLKFRGFRPSLSMIKNIYAVGLPSILMQSIGSVMAFGMAQILLMFSQTAATLFGVYFRLQSFIFMPVFGLTNGLVPIVAYNYGAKNRTRIERAIRLSVFYALGIMAIGLVLFQLFPKQLLMIFNASDEMLSIGIPALRIISLHFIIAGFCIVVSSVFQALGNGVFSLVMSLARQLGALLPVAYLLAHYFGLHAVWYCFLVAELVSFVLSLFFFRRIRRTKIGILPTGVSAD